MLITRHYQPLLRLLRLLCVIIVCTGLLCYVLLSVGSCNGDYNCSNAHQTDRKAQLDAREDIAAHDHPETLLLRAKTQHSHVTQVNLAVVSCGDRLEETLMMLKSALSLGTVPIHAHIFASDSLRPMFNESLDKWSELIKWRWFNYSIYPITFPDHAAEWKELFKPCASQRLFIPDLLSDVDLLLYVDTDVLFLSPPETIWTQFENFSSLHLAALAPESEDSSTNWYTRFARHPFYKPLGVNSGVMLMNLTRMRQAKWTAFHWPLLQKYKFNLTWGDQDIINIIFHDRPEWLYLYSCAWNYRPDHCMYMSVCKAAESSGAYLVHGSRSYFHSSKQPVFHELYEAFKTYRLGSDLQSNLVAPLTESLGLTANASHCGKVADIFLKQLQNYVRLR